MHGARLARFVAGIACAAPLLGLAAQSTPAPTSTTQTSSADSTDLDSLFEAGRQLFDQYAPPDVKAQYEFPSKKQWDSFALKLQQALQNDSLDDLAAFAPQARAALSTLRTLGADNDLADWLEQRLDEAEAAQQVAALPQTAPPRPAVTPPQLMPGPPQPPPGLRPPETVARRIPYYDFWYSRLQSRPIPERAAQLMPVLRSAFAAEGVPPALAWLAEAESSLNPTARSPAGAKGLFQLMPDTAKRLGLGTFMPDERTNPEKSAHAAAKYLRELHDRFDSWPLALAAYNAGEGRVTRALASRKAKDFAGIADALPAETRMYVPKVCALVAARTSTRLATL